MKYKIGIRQKGRDPQHAVLKLKLEADGADCQFIYQVITYALGNSQRVSAFIEANTSLEIEEEQVESKVGFA